MAAPAKFLEFDTDLEQAKIALRCFLATPAISKAVLDDITEQIVKRMQFYIDRGGVYASRSLNRQRHPVTGNAGPQLRQTGELRNNIGYKMSFPKKGVAQASIGWPTEVLNLRARLHELGASIGNPPSHKPVAPHWRSSGRYEEYNLQFNVGEAFERMRKWLHAQMRDMGVEGDEDVEEGEATNAFFIPARPFIWPAVKDILDNTKLLEKKLDSIVMAAANIAKRTYKKPAVSKFRVRREVRPRVSQLEIQQMMWSELKKILKREAVSSLSSIGRELGGIQKEMGTIERGISNIR